MRSSVAFAVIGLTIACWASIAAAEDSTQATTDKGGKIVANAPRQVDITHGVSTIQNRTGATAIANLRAAAATASAIEPHSISVTGSLMGAGVVTAGSVSAASVATSKAGLYIGLVVTHASAAGVRTDPTLIQAAGIATSAAGSDRTGAVASFGSVQTAAARPMGTGAAAGNLTAVGVRPDAATRQSGVVAVGGVLSAAAAASWKTGLTRGAEATNTRATILAAAPTSILIQRADGVTPRAVGIWNSATSMGGPVQRAKPIRNKH